MAALPRLSAAMPILEHCVHWGGLLGHLGSLGEQWGRSGHMFGRKGKEVFEDVSPDPEAGHTSVVSVSGWYHFATHFCRNPVTAVD